MQSVEVLKLHDPSKQLKPVWCGLSVNYHGRDMRSKAGRMGSSKSVANFILEMFGSIGNDVVELVF